MFALARRSRRPIRHPSLPSRSITAISVRTILGNRMKADELWLRGPFEWNVTCDLTVKSQMYGCVAKRMFQPPRSRRTKTFRRRVQLRALSTSADVASRSSSSFAPRQGWSVIMLVPGLGNDDPPVNFPSVESYKFRLTLCRSTLCRSTWAEDLGTKMKTLKPKQWSDSEIQRLLKLVRAGAGASKIAAELGRHAGSVRRMARSKGILLKKSFSRAALQRKSEQ